MPDTRATVIAQAREWQRRQVIEQAREWARSAAPGVDEPADATVEPTRPPRELVLPTMEIRQGEEGRFADEPALDIVRDEEGMTVTPLRESGDPSSVSQRYRNVPENVMPGYGRRQYLAPERVITGRQYAAPTIVAEDIPNWVGGPRRYIAEAANMVPFSSATHRIAPDTATLGWGDEAQALVRATLARRSSPWSVLFGEGRPDYERELQVARNQQLSAEEQASTADVIGGRVVGSLPLLLAPGGPAAAGGRAALAVAPRAAAGGRMARSVPQLLRMAGGALEGGAVGALAGAGYAEDDRLSGALEGGAVGAGLGAGLAGGAGAVRDRVANLLQRPVARAEQMVPGLRRGADIRQIRSVIGPNVTGVGMSKIAGVRRGRPERVRGIVETMDREGIRNADDLIRVEQEYGDEIGRLADRFDDVAARNRRYAGDDSLPAAGSVNASEVARDFRELARWAERNGQRPEAAALARGEADYWDDLPRVLADRRSPTPDLPEPASPSLPSLLGSPRAPIGAAGQSRALPVIQPSSILDPNGLPVTQYSRSNLHPFPYSEPPSTTILDPRGLPMRPNEPMPQSLPNILGRDMPLREPTSQPRPDYARIPMPPERSSAAPQNIRDQEIPFSIALNARRAIDDDINWSVRDNGRLAPAARLRSRFRNIVNRHLQDAAAAADPYLGNKWRVANRTFSQITGPARRADIAALSRGGNRLLTLTNTMGLLTGAGVGAARGGPLATVAGAAAGGVGNAAIRSREHGIAARGMRTAANIFQTMRPRASAGYDAATARVPRAAAASHFLRSQTDPLYRIEQLLSDENENENENEETEWESEPLP